MASLFYDVLSSSVPIECFVDNSCRRSCVRSSYDHGGQDSARHVMQSEPFKLKCWGGSGLFKDAARSTNIGSPFDYQ